MLFYHGNQNSVFVSLSEVGRSSHGWYRIYFEPAVGYCDERLRIEARTKLSCNQEVEEFGSLLNRLNRTDVLGVSLNIKAWLVK